MATITKARVRLKLTQQMLVADCFGNNMALLCPICVRGAILLIARPNQRGSDKDHRARCPACDADAYILDYLGDATKFDEVHVFVAPPEIEASNAVNSEPQPRPTS